MDQMCEVSILEHLFLLDYFFKSHCFQKAFHVSSNQKLTVTEIKYNEYTGANTASAPQEDCTVLCAKE
jgi:hypothetical protein